MKNIWECQSQNNAELIVHRVFIQARGVSNHIKTVDTHIRIDSTRSDIAYERNQCRTLIMCGVKTDTIRQACGLRTHLLTHTHTQRTEDEQTAVSVCYKQHSQWEQSAAARAVTHSKCWPPTLLLLFGSNNVTYHVCSYSCIATNNQYMPSSNNSSSSSSSSSSCGRNDGEGLTKRPESHSQCHTHAAMTKRHAFTVMFLRRRACDNENARVCSTRRLWRHCVVAYAHSAREANHRYDRIIKSLKFTPVKTDNLFSFPTF